MNNLSDRSTSRLMLDLVLAAFRVPDEQLNAMATEFCGRFGAQAVRRLVLEAVNSRNRPEHRVRLLRAIQRISVVEPSSHLELYPLIADKNPKVRAAAIAAIAG